MIIALLHFTGINIKIVAITQF